MTYCLLYDSNIPILPYPYIAGSVESSCIGLDFNNIESWKEYWVNANNTHENCSTLFYNMIYSGENRMFSKDGFEQVSQNFNFIFKTYFQQNSPTTKGNHKLGVPGDVSYDDFQEILIQTCSNNPEYELYGACQYFANNFCQTCNSDQVASNTDLLKLCGCQVESLDYSTGLYDDVPKSCDPLCNHEQIVKNIDPITGVVDECNSDVCVINNISIVSTESTVGSVNFYQVCPQCTGTKVCICILDVDVSADVDINNNVEFYQYCGENSICIVVDQNGEENVVDCSSQINTVVATDYSNSYPIPIIIWIIIFIIILLFIYVLITVNTIHKNET